MSGMAVSSTAVGRIPKRNHALGNPPARLSRRRSTLWAIPPKAIGRLSRGRFTPWTIPPKAIGR
jgi:hypothetical protein